MRQFEKWLVSWMGEVSKRTVLFLDVRLREQEMRDLFCQNTFPCFVANCQDQVCKCKLLHLQALAFRGSAIRLVCWRHGSQSMIFTVQRMRPPSPPRPPLVLFLSGVPRVRCPSRRLCSHASHLCDYRSHRPNGITLGSKEPRPYFGVLYYKK